VIIFSYVIWLTKVLGDYPKKEKEWFEIVFNTNNNNKISTILSARCQKKKIFKTKVF